MVKQNLELKITNDFIFKEFFEIKNENKEYPFLKSLVESLLEETIECIELKPTELNGENIDAKERRLNLVARINENRLIDLEMQIQTNMNEIFDRAAIYAAQLLVSQESKGKNYSEFDRTHTVFFVANNVYGEDEPFYNPFNFVNRNGTKVLTKVTNVHIIELKKSLNAEDYTQCSMLQKWSIFIYSYKQGITDERILKMIESEEILKEAVQMFGELTQDEIMKDRAFAREKIERDIAQIRYEGRKEGHNAGIEEGKQEIAKKLKEEGIDDELIVKYTGLTLEQIQEL